MGSRWSPWPSDGPTKGGLANILDYIPKGITLLPNTSGARNAEEAIRIARLCPGAGLWGFWQTGNHPGQPVPASGQCRHRHSHRGLITRGFKVMPYMCPDLNTARDLADAGAVAIMPLGAPIDSNQGLLARPSSRFWWTKWIHR